MPFDVGESINNIADTFLRAPIVNTVAKNPIYTALLITFMVMLTIMFVFRDADTEESLLVLCLRSGFWIFLMMLGTLFLHNKVLVQEQDIADKNVAYDGVFNGGYDTVTPSILEDYVVPVTINTNFSSTQ